MPSRMQSDARFGEAFDEALVTVVERAVLGKLTDADLVGFSEGDGGGEDQGDGDDGGNDALHNVFLLFKMAPE